MHRRFWVGTAAFVWAALSAWAVPDAAGRQDTPPSAPAARQQQTVTSYCLTCHNARAKTGGLVLEGLDPADAPAHPDVWEKVIRKVRAMLGSRH